MNTFDYSSLQQYVLYDEVHLTYVITWPSFTMPVSHRIALAIPFVDRVHPYAQQEWLCNIGYRPKTNLKLKSREISFVCNIHFRFHIVLNVSTEQASITAARKIIKWLSNLVVRDGQTRFQEI